MKIKNVIPEYTGGGIYCFTGELQDGNYFLADCPISASYYSLRIVNENPGKYDPNEVWTEEWQLDHFVKDVTRCKGFIKNMLKWIIKNRPDGNYLVSDMEEILTELIDLVSNDEEEEKTYTFSVNLPKEDYEILNQYDFYFEKNISEYLQQIASELKR